MDPWNARIARAERLAEADAVNRGRLAFYARLLRAQQRLADRLTRAALHGAIEEDVAILRPLLPLLLQTVSAYGPPPLAGGARELARAADEAIGEMLVEQWRAPRATQFFAKALLQPYAAGSGSWA